MNVFFTQIRQHSDPVWARPPADEPPAAAAISGPVARG